MQWRGRRQSSNVEDLRGGGARRGIAIGGMGTILVIILALILGKNPGELLQLVGNLQTQQAEAPQGPQPDDEAAAFVKVVLADCEDVWHKLFREAGMQYKEPTLVLFRDGVRSACGSASSAMGPFYCGADEKIYIDLSFYDELHSRFKAPGDFAMAYVVAHEVGHHIQNILGISGKVHAQRHRLSQEEYNKLSVRLELQADFLAGVWAHHAQKMKQILESGDIEEALNAANAIGDDRLQKQAQGYVVPDAFTHGTSEQRMRWFKKGFTTGDLNQGDTFGMDYASL
ncbi:MAG: zinc metallopeptidase [Chitinophagales bacterium]|nr:zinc metallopeptidase [Chitinophagales bacterium]MDW8419649.1 neutral zinc metallopeptidase [Chitinophagales bacterium]